MADEPRGVYQPEVMPSADGGGMSPEVPAIQAGSPLTGRLCIVLAAVLWSTSGLFTKAPLFDDWPLEERGVLLAFWRALFAGLCVLPLVRRPRWDWKLLPMVGCFAGMSIAYMTSVTLNTAANAIWLQSTAPLWVLLYTVLIWRGGVRREDVSTLIFCALGLGLILYYEFSEGSGAGAPAQSRWGVLCGLAAGACYGGVIVSLHALRAHHAVWLVVINQLTTAAVLAPWALSLGRWPSGWQLATLAAFGALQIAVPYLLFTRGLRSVPSQEASLLGLLEPVLVPFWVLFALGNQETRWWTVAGGGLILLGLAFRYLPGTRTGARAGNLHSASASAPKSSGP